MHAVPSRILFVPGCKCCFSVKGSSNLRRGTYSSRGGTEVVNSGALATRISFAPRLTDRGRTGSCRGWSCSHFSVCLLDWVWECAGGSVPTDKIQVSPLPPAMHELQGVLPSHSLPSLTQWLQANKQSFPDNLHWLHGRTWSQVAEEWVSINNLIVTENVSTVDSLAL